MNATTATPAQLVEYILSNSESDSLLAFTRDVQAQMVTIGVTAKQLDALRRIARSRSVGGRQTTRRKA
jgi:hypothetical protein